MLAYLKKLELDTAKFPGAMPVCGECVYRKTDKQQEQIQSIHEIRERAERKTVWGMNQKDMVDKAVRRVWPGCPEADCVTEQIFVADIRKM